MVHLGANTRVGSAALLDHGPSAVFCARARAQEAKAAQAYTWSYDGEDVTVVVPLPAGLGKKDISVQCSAWPAYE